VVVTELEISEVVSPFVSPLLLRARNLDDETRRSLAPRCLLALAENIWIVKTYEAMKAAYPHPDNSLRNAAVGAVVSFLFLFLARLNQTTSSEARSRKSSIELITSSAFFCSGE